MQVRKFLLSGIIVAAGLAVSPRPASADWVVTPFVGWNTGGSADVNGTSGTTTSSKFERKADFGVSLSTMGKGVVGAEIDFGYSPNFFGNTTNNDGFQFASNSNVTTLTGNLIVGAPVGGHGSQIRPYAVAGVGLIRTRVQDAGELFDVNSKNDFGFDVGGGVMGFLSQNVGLRGDVRYFRSFRGSEADTVTGLALSDFRFWRASLGVSFKF